MQEAPAAGRRVAEVGGNIRRKSLVDGCKYICHYEIAVRSRGVQFSVITAFSVFGSIYGVFGVWASACYLAISVRYLGVVNYICKYLSEL